MKNNKTIVSVTDDTYTLQSTEFINKLDYFKNDGSVLEKTDLEAVPSLYQKYLNERAITDPEYKNVSNEWEYVFGSADKKKITIITREHRIERNPNRSSIKRLFKR
jgi:hypothetical protein